MNQRNQHIDRIGFWILCLVFILAISCEETVDLPLPLDRQRVVINGWVNSNQEAYTVTVKRTIGFNDHDTDAGLSGAEVYVLDRLSRRFDFLETNTIGVYQSDPDLFQGVPGDAYTLYVGLTDGTQYISNREVLNPVPALDTIFFDSTLDPLLAANDPDAESYFVRGRIVDIPNIKNFYRWKMFVNGDLLNNPDELVIFDDKFTDGNVFETKIIDILLKEGDELRLEQWSLTQGAFDFYSLLSTQIGQVDIGPSTQPSAVTGNMRNVNDPQELVLGYFGASDITVRTATVQPQ